MEQEYPSPLLEAAVARLSSLPGIGRRTALRLALHLLRRDVSEAVALGQAIMDLRRDIRYCSVCHNISDDEVCPICSSAGRDRSTVCVVENVRDVMSVERTGSTTDCIMCSEGHIAGRRYRPDMLEIDSLVERVRAGGIGEVILALPATMEGDTTDFYIYRRLEGVAGLRVTQLARGMAVGNDIEYTDELTLGRSLLQRTPFGV